MKCQFCDKDVMLPFECPFCKDYFCIEHRLPENHACLRAPPRTSLGHWKAKKPPLFQHPGEKMTKPPKRPISVHVMPVKTRKSRRVIGFLLIGLIVGIPIGSFSWHFLITLPTIQEWQQQVTQLKIDLDVATKEKATLEINLRDLQSELTKLEDEKHLLEQEISSLEREFDVLKIRYEDLDKTYKDLNKKYEELFADYSWVNWVLTEVFDRPLEQIEVPSTSDVRAWLTSDRTDRFRYTDPDFVCGDFAIVLALHARAKHWDMGVIAIWGYEAETRKEFNHALNAMVTKEGLIYIEPQTDDLWWYENHQAIREGETYGIGTYETVEVYIEDVQIILNY